MSRNYKFHNPEGLYFTNEPHERIRAGAGERYQKTIIVTQNPGAATRGQIAAIIRYYNNGYLNNDDK